MDSRRLFAFHGQHQCLCTLVVDPHNHPYDSDLVVTDSSGAIRQIAGKNEPRGRSYGNCVNAGICVLDRAVLDRLQAGAVYDLERDVIGPVVGEERAYVYRTTEYIKDMGTPERHAEVTRHVASGLVAGRNLKRQHPSRLPHHDRPTHENSLLPSHPRQLQVPDEVYTALAAINDSGFLAIVVSNQPVVARNLCSLDELNEI